MIHSHLISTLVAINYGFVSPGSGSYHLSGSVGFVPATVSRQDVICADILDLDKPHKERILRLVPLSCNRKEEDPEVHRKSFSPRSRDFCIETFVEGQTCERESTRQTSFEGGTLIHRMDDRLVALLV